MRRELRKLGARREPRGPGPRASPGSTRERAQLEIAQLITERKTIINLAVLMQKTFDCIGRSSSNSSSRVEAARDDLGAT